VIVLPEASVIWNVQPVSLGMVDVSTVTVIVWL
jgi:hypothetical protein